MTKPTLFFVIILFISMIFRLILSPIIFHADLLSQASWGLHVSQTGPSTLYSHNKWIFAWPNHPPLASLAYGYAHQLYLSISLRLHQSLLFIDKYHLPFPYYSQYQQFVQEFEPIVSPQIPFSFGFLVSLKIIPIMADLLIAILIYQIASRLRPKPLLYPLLYLCSPFSWYISSLWGQTDQLACFFTLFSFLLLPRQTLLSVVSIFISIMLKPTSLFVAPLFLYLLLRLRPQFLTLLASSVICVFLTFLIFQPFSPDMNIIDFTLNHLLPRLADRPSRLTTNSYNFWHIFVLDQGLSSRFGDIFGLAIYTLLNLFSFRLLRQITPKTIIASLFIISFGSWLFLTNMLDRYSFLGIISGLVLTIYFSHTLRYWLILSIIFWLNLFRGWWYPGSFYFLKSIMTVNHGLFGIIPSLTNLLVYFLIIKSLLPTLLPLSEPRKKIQK